MNQYFQDLSAKQDLLKARYIFLTAVFCSPIFYLFMKYIEIGSTDSLTLRLVISLFGLLGFLLTFYKSNYQKQITTISYIVVRGSWMLFYLYLLEVNHWTIYQRWSYFVLIFVLCSTAFSWRDYLLTTFFSVLAPAIVGVFSHHISVLEQIHFHAANIATLLVMGLSIKGHFRFKKEAEFLTNTLIEKSQMSVLGEIAAGISHEVNTPLMVFSYSLHQLNRQLNQETPDREKIVMLTGKMNRMIERISNIVNALKVYSIERSDDKFEKVNIQALIDEALTICNRKFIDNGITIQKDNSDIEMICLAKKSQIIQCFLNLFNNAIEASHTMQSPKIIINTSIKESFALISISDNGTGISDDVAAKIMHPFFTTKEIGKGTGLGLSVSQGIARGHQGELSLDKSLSPSTFVLKLPLA